MGMKNLETMFSLLILRETMYLPLSDADEQVVFMSLVHIVSLIAIGSPASGRVEESAGFCAASTDGQQ